MATETLFPVKKLLRFTEDQERRIAVYRHTNHIGTENEAIRRLIDLGLEAASGDAKASYDPGPARQKETAK